MSNKRIAANATAAYIKSLLTAGLSLLSSRWVLASLGQVDYGIFFVVGSIIVFITFLNSTMAGSVARYLAYSIGQEDLLEINSWFNAALGIHILLAVLLILFGLPVGEFVIANKLNLAQGRTDAALLVFRISLISSFVSMASVPFVAMFTAKQQIVELAFWGMVQTSLAFCLALSLSYCTTDRLVYYAIGMASIIVFVQIVQVIRAFFNFDECKIVFRKIVDFKRLRQMSSFAMWTLIGSFGGLFRDQGSAIILNLFFGPKINASFGIATQISNQTNQLSAAMMGAFTPEITSCEGQGNRIRMLTLSERISKFGALLVALPGIPLFIEMNYVLKVWLKTPPPFAGLFCKMVLVTFLIDRVSSGYMVAINAHGRIAAYQATLGTVLFLSLPMTWLLFMLGLEPGSIWIAFIGTMSITSFGRVLWARYFFKVAVRKWVAKIIIPSLLVIFVSSCAALCVSLLMQPSFLRLLAVTGTAVVANAICSWFFVLDGDEKAFLTQETRKYTKFQ